MNPRTAGLSGSPPAALPTMRRGRCMHWGGAFDPTGRCDWRSAASCVTVPTRWRSCRPTRCGVALHCGVCLVLCGCACIFVCVRVCVSCCQRVCLFVQPRNCPPPPHLPHTCSNLHTFARASPGWVPRWKPTFHPGNQAVAPGSPAHIASDPRPKSSAIKGLITHSPTCPSTPDHRPPPPASQ